MFHRLFLLGEDISEKIVRLFQKIKKKNRITEEKNEWKIK